MLAVDDDPQALRYVRDALSKAGYTPIVTGDPEEALRLLEEEKPRLALLDLMLPGTDGIDLMRDILEMADVPVIFLSAYGRDELIARAFDMGAADYVVKPFSPTELSARIRAALRRREAPEQAEPTEPYTLGDLEIDYAERRRVRGRSSGPADRHRVPDARRAFGKRRKGGVLRASAATGLGGEERRRRAAHAHRRKQPPPQAGRRRGQPNLHLHRASRRLPDAKGGDARAGEGVD